MPWVPQERASAFTRTACAARVICVPDYGSLPPRSLWSIPQSWPVCILSLQPHPSNPQVSILSRPCLCLQGSEHPIWLKSARAAEATPQKRRVRRSSGQQVHSSPHRQAALPKGQRPNTSWCAGCIFSKCTTGVAIFDQSYFSCGLMAVGQRMVTSRTLRSVQSSAHGYGHGLKRSCARRHKGATFPLPRRLRSCAYQDIRIKGSTKKKAAAAR